MKSILLLSLLLTYTSLFSQIISNDFDESTGANSYSGISSSNWYNGSTGLGITENAGIEFIASANGNATGTFPNMGITKTLGGTIANHPYRVSFYIAVYNDGALPLVGLEYADFSTLRIGGPNGTVVWDSVPTPTVYGQWVYWSAIYTPDPADIGQPFTFECMFDLDAYHAVGIDGPFMMHDPSLGISDAIIIGKSKEVVKIIDTMGRETEYKPNTLLIYIYSDGTTEKVCRVE
jgi:hypothetical protein